MIICNTRVLNAPVTGVQRYLTEIVKRFPKEEVRYAAPPNWVRRPFNLVWEQILLPQYVRSGDILWSPSNSGALRVHRQVMTVHDLSTRDFPEEYSRAYRQYHDLLFPSLLPKIAGVITVSDYSRQRLLATYALNPDKVHSIHLGVDHDRFRPQKAEAIEAVRCQLGLPSRYVLALGNMSARKNLKLLIEAWSDIENSIDSDTYLVIAGGTPAVHVFNKNELPELPPRTLLTGRVAEAHLAPILAGSAVFVFPSLYEGFGLPPLEAMACGAPCLSSNVTSLPEVVGDAALTFSPHDRRALSRLLLDVLSNPNLAASLRRKGLARAAEFSWEKTADSTLKVLRSAAGRVG